MNQIKSHSLRTIREEFNEYDLDDGNIIRSKQILIVFGLTGEQRKDESGQNLATSFVSMKHVAGVVPLAKIDTSALELYANQPLDKSSYLKKIQFTPKQTFFNIYETDEFLISVETKVTEIWQSKYKDDNGTPVYHVISEGLLDARQKNDENKQKLTTI